jgi:predicted PurR-regulated permease PerM
MPDSSSNTPPAPAKIAPAGTPGPAQTSLLLVFVVVVAGLYLAREVLVPVTLAVLLSFLLAPLVGLFRRIHLGRTPSVFVAVIIALGVILALGGLIGTQIASLASDAPRYTDTIEHKIDSVRQFTVGRLSGVIASMGSRLAPPAPATSTRANPAAPVPGSGDAEQKPIPVVVQQPSATPIELASRYLSPALSPLATLGIVLIVSIFILLQREDLRDRLIRLVGSGDLHSTTLALDDGGRRLSRYFLTQLGVNVGFGCVIGVGLFFIGVPSPLLWGVLSAMLRFVPYVGSILSAAFPIALAAAVDPGWSMALWTLALYFIVEPLVGQVVEPLLYGHSTGLSPIAVIISAIFWSWIWGPIGLVLSTPLTLCLVVLGRHVKRLEFLDVMLGDRPALTPVESFYQRILSGDSDEVREHAEALLKERSLSTYYDEVAVKGLQLAEQDAQRGILHQDQLERIKEVIRDVVSDLEGFEDREPKTAEGDKRAFAPADDENTLVRNPVPDRADPVAEDLPAQWRLDAAVLCLAGRGPLDEAAASMLAQLLRKHGVGSQLVPHEAVSRNRIGSLPVAGVAMICISYLEISGHPAHLRYLLERLRQRLPGVAVLVGLWPMEDAVMKNLALRKEVGASYYTTSLREAVNACLEEARKATPSGTTLAILGSSQTAEPAGPKTDDGMSASLIAADGGPYDA